MAKIAKKHPLLGMSVAYCIYDQPQLKYVRCPPTATRQAIDAMLMQWLVWSDLYELLLTLRLPDLVVNPLSTLYSIRLWIICLVLQQGPKWTWYVHVMWVNNRPWGGIVMLC